MENKNTRRKSDRKHAREQFILVTGKLIYKLKCQSMSSSAVCASYTGIIRFGKIKLTGSVMETNIRVLHNEENRENARS